MHYLWQTYYCTVIHYSDLGVQMMSSWILHAFLTSKKGAKVRSLWHSNSPSFALPENFQYNQILWERMGLGL